MHGTCYQQKWQKYIWIATFKNHLGRHEQAGDTWHMDLVQTDGINLDGFMVSANIKGLFLSCIVVIPRGIWDQNISSDGPNQELEISLKIRDCLFKKGKINFSSLMVMSLWSSFRRWWKQSECSLGWGGEIQLIWIKCKSMLHSEQPWCY